ncbi:MAG: alpha-amylase family glycosyl hydrolase [Bacteroidia bacterium]|nr:alpha-amylase family glycosyl hydrolase [Bacteroidia bacterium]
MSKRLLTILLSSVFIIPLEGQMITTDPYLPVMGQSLKIYFNSSYKDQGTLQNYTGDLYVHTGVTISGTTWKHVIGTWGTNSTQPKLKYLGNYIYELDITDIATFYSLSSGEVATQISLVFRSPDASKQTRPDIFVDVYPSGLFSKFILPEKSSFVTGLNRKIPVKAAATYADSVSLYINGVFIKSGKTHDLVTDTLTAIQYGEFWVKAVAWKKPSFSADSFYFYVRKPVVSEELPAGMKDGINYTGNNSVTLVLHAPYKDNVFVVGDFTGWIAREKGYMRKTPDAERYWIRIDGLEAGKEYRFQYLVDSALFIADPYADKVLDPWNDSYITAETYPDLIPYPKDTASGMVSVLQTAQAPYAWDVVTFEPPDKSELIIYELLIRDFIGRHDFRTLIDTLHYLDDLGVNAIELMPVSEFEGNLSWGYNPSFYFAPDKYYGPKNDMKAFVDSCHARGIAVILDMVLNHCNGQSPFVQLYLDHYGTDEIFMKTPNPWFNASSPNPVYKWGADFNHESTDTQELVDRITEYWLTEYNIDGFRFDFTKGFTNTSGDGSSYDASRINILKRMASRIWSVKSDAYVILEHFAPNSEEIELSNYGIMLWGNNNYVYSEAAMGFSSDLTSASYLGRSWNVPNLISYMESHDEERLMYKTLTYGASSATYNTKDLQTALKRMELDVLFFLTVPGPKMIWQFGELGYDISIDLGGRTSEKPIKWEYYSDVKRYKLFQFYKLMNILKTTQPVFYTGTTYTWSLSSFTKRMQLISNDNKAVILGNFGTTSADINPAFPVAGKWYEYFSGDSVTISNINGNLNFGPGEYRLYTTKRMPSSRILLDVEDHEITLNENFVTAYPNPSNGEFNFIIKNAVPAPVSITIFDLNGRMIRQFETEITDISVPIKWDGKTVSGYEAPAGLYFVQIRSALRSGNIKIIKN